MKVTELHIGDWVRVEGHGDCQVEALDSDGTVLVDGDYYCTEDDCSPVPLTADILAKNGFRRKKDWMQFGNFGDMPLIMWHTAHNKTLGNYPNQLAIDNFVGDDNYREHYWARVRCDWVHEMQRALLSCKVKKEIVL